jgi:hypothetical protein
LAFVFNVRSQVVRRLTRGTGDAFRPDSFNVHKETTMSTRPKSKSRMLTKSKMNTKQLRNVTGGLNNGQTPSPKNVRPDGPGWLPPGFDKNIPGGGILE